MISLAEEPECQAAGGGEGRCDTCRRHGVTVGPPELRCLYKRVSHMEENSCRTTIQP
jgi:hypothetical protein